MIDIRGQFQPYSVSLEDLFKGEKQYKVPSFQRDYSWEIEEWGLLWQDVWFVWEKKVNSHYLGTIVVKEEAETPNTGIVIDGQQRLTTLSIMVLAIIKSLLVLVEQEKANVLDTTHNEKRVKLLKNFFTYEDVNSLAYQSKLKLNRTNDDFYRNYLVQFRKHPNFRSESKSNKEMSKALDFFYSQLSEHPELSGSGEALAKFFDCVRKQLLLIEIKVFDDVSAFNIFETLNARNVALTTSDLLKNYIFSLASSIDLQTVESQWLRISEKIDGKDLSQFFRYFLNSEATENEIIRTHQLYKKFKDRLNDIQVLSLSNQPTTPDLFEFLDMIETEAIVYHAIKNPESEYWLGFEDVKLIKNILHILSLFEASQMIPLVMACIRTWKGTSKVNEIVKVLKLCLVITFRYSKVGGLNPNKLEKIYTQAASKVVSGSCKTARQLFDTGLIEAYVEDQAFENAFSLLEVKYRNGSRKLIQYIYHVLETKDPYNFPTMVQDNITIEHILPQNPQESWYESFGDKKAMASAEEKIGNYTLLESKLNKDCGSKPFSEKKIVYDQSQYSLTRKLTACEEWTPQSLRERQEALAKLAIEIWKHPF